MRIDTHNIPSYILTNNLNEDYIRKGNQASKNLHNLGYGQVTKYEGVSCPRKGCDKSHLKLLSDPKVKTPFILFEDDIVPMRSDHVFEIPYDADALYLGTSCWSRAWNFWMYDAVIYSDYSDDIVRINNMLCSHAVIILTESYRDIMRRCNEYSLKQEYNEVCGDQYIVELMKLFNVYAVDQPVFAQEGKYYDYTSKSIRSSGWTKQVAQEFYDKHLGPLHRNRMESILPVQDTNKATSFEPLNYN